MKGLVILLLAVNATFFAWTYQSYLQIDFPNVQHTLPRPPEGVASLHLLSELRAQEAETAAVLDLRGMSEVPDLMAIESTDASEPDAEPIAEADASEPDAEPIAEADASEPDAEPIAEADASEPDAEPIAEADASEPDAEPIAEADASELDAEPIADADASEPDAEPIAEADASEPDAEPIAEADASEPDAEPIAEADASEPDAEPIADADASEPDAEPIADADASEPDAEPIAEADASEPDAEPIADADASEPDAESTADADAPEPAPPGQPDIKENAAQELVQDDTEDTALIEELLPAQVLEFNEDISGLMAEAKDAADSCFSFGPITNETEAAALEQWLQARKASTSRRITEQQEREYYWLYIEPASSTQNLVKTVEHLRQQGILDYRLINRGNLKNAISLGLFNSRAEVEARFRQLEEQNFQPLILPYREPIRLYWVDSHQTGPLSPEFFSGLASRYSKTTILCSELHANRPE